MLVFVTMLAGCAQCQPLDASASEGPTPPITQPPVERTLQADERLAPFQRRTLKPFSTDVGLQRFLEALAFVRDASWNAPIPELPPARERALHPSAPLSGERSNRAAALPRTIGVLTALPSEHRLAQHGDTALLLYQNELRSFALASAAPWLTPRARIALGPTFPEIRAMHIDLKGEPQGAAAVEPDALAGVTLFDHVLAGPAGEVVAIGRRIDTQAIELVFLSLADDGTLHHEAARTIHYRLADHERADARVVDGALVLYLQHDPVYETQPSVPSLSSADRPPEPLLHGEDVQYPLYAARDTVLHTLVRCTFPSAGLHCTARAIPAAPAQHVALSDDAAYAWLLDWHGERPTIRAAYLYRLPFDGSAPTAVHTRAPFLDPALALHADGEHVRALVPAASSAAVDVLDVPVSAFSARATQLTAASYRRVPGLQIGQNESASAQLVDAHWLVRRGPAARAAAGAKPLIDGSIDVVARDGSKAARVPLDHASSQLTALGDHALLTGSDGKDVRTTLVALDDDAPRVVADRAMADAAHARSAETPLPLRFGASDGCLTADLRDTEGDAESLLPLRWNADASALEPLAPWRVAHADQPHTQPSGRDALTVRPDLTLIRLQAELLAVRCAGRLELAQRIALSR